MKAALQNYHARMQRVLDHIDWHLDDDLGLDAVDGKNHYRKLGKQPARLSFFI